MTTIRRLLSIPMLFFLLMHSVNAEDGGNFPPERWSFEDPIPDYVGSRAIAVGNAYTAIAEGATAGFWNPAGLIQSRGVALFGQMRLNGRQEWAFDPKSIRFCYRRWALFWGNKIAVRLPKRTPDYNYYALAFRLSERAAFGIAMSFERRHPWDTYQWFGSQPRLHLGMLFYPRNSIRLALATHGTRSLDVGAAWNQKHWLAVMRVRWLSDDEGNTSKSTSFLSSIFRPSPFALYTGLEKPLWHGLTARLGISAGSPAAGLGWRWRTLHLDYAWILEHDQSIHFLSLEIAR